MAGGVQEVVGPAAHDTPAVGAPIRVAGRYYTPAAITSGDVGDIPLDSFSYPRVVLAEPGANQNIDVYATNADAITTGRVLRTGAFGYGLAPDGAWDRLRTLQNTAPGLGVLAAAPYTPGASDVKATTVDIGATSVNRATALTPTSGKKVRIISAQVSGHGLTTAPGRIGIYFGTGAAFTTTATKAITELVLPGGTTGSQEHTWPDGGGPVGAVNDVVSWITEAETETGLRLTLQYREE